jgi:hypothetical protein
MQEYACHLFHAGSFTETQFFHSYRVEHAAAMGKVEAVSGILILHLTINS